MSTDLTAEAAEEIRRGLGAIRRQTGLNSGEAQLMRYTINAVYKLDNRVLRLSRGGAAQERAEKVVRGVALLRQHEVPVVDLDETFDQPVIADQWVATIWHYLPHAEGRPEPVELAAPLARLHAIADSPSYLPQWATITTARRRLGGLSALPADDLLFTERWVSREVGMSLDSLVALLLDQCDDLEGQIAAATWQLPTGLIHGDAHVGNLLAGRLCDFDSLAVGPREWDLVPLVHSFVRFGESNEPYKQFAAAYGFDLTSSSSWPLLREVRELQLVTSVLDKLPGRPEVAHTLGHRLRTYLAGDRSAIWQRYR
ncbi:aminoglycoside phosphotransferase family protein [Micromonospora sp. HUAS LYJ1]|uniref:phosphotransferase n=1 Tax=Micromonospora sp. HUAS LYJ1 TaxID=3061626 RepID=UPI00267305D6|nr:aminoglycoside phosphotransferase family protein [Micromonospora sp. HUAS LYJ1]WKU03470.1 aminoglycoside phosphotransferase family protein [Micromonospora sp. HUAS LYJ1]